VALRAQGDRIAIEWPEGKPFEVTDEIGVGAARFSVRSAGDEITVGGDLVLPGGGRVDLAEILGYTSASRGAKMPSCDALSVLHSNDCIAGRTPTS